MARISRYIFTAVNLRSKNFGNLRRKRIVTYNDNSVSSIVL